jgi:hypothetical protein
VSRHGGGLFVATKRVFVAPRSWARRAEDHSGGKTVQTIPLSVHVPALEPGATPPAQVPQPRWSLFVDEPAESPPFVIVGPSLTVVQPRVAPGAGARPEPLRLEIAFTGERAELLARHRTLIHTVPQDLNVPDLVTTTVETGAQARGGPRVVVEIGRDVFARLGTLLWCRFVVSLRVRVTTDSGASYVMPLPVGVQLFAPEPRRGLGERAKASADLRRLEGAGRSALATATLAGPDDGRLCLSVDARSGEPLRFPNLFAPQSWESEELRIEPLVCFVRSGVCLHLLLEQVGAQRFVGGAGSTLDPRLLGSSSALELYWQGVSHSKLAQGPRDGLVIGHSNPDVALVGSGTDGASAEIAWFEGSALEVPRIASFFFSVQDEAQNIRLVDPTVMNDPVEEPDPGPPPLGEGGGEG